MPNFNAQEREVAQPDRPGATVPQCTHGDLPKWGDGNAVTVWYYRHATHRELDVIKPGYFNGMRDNFRAASNTAGINMIVCHLGKLEDGLAEVCLHVVDAPKDRDTDVIVAKGPSRKFTPVRHDGSLTAEGNSGKKAA